MRKALSACVLASFCFVSLIGCAPAPGGNSAPAPASQAASTAPKADAKKADSKKADEKKADSKKKDKAAPANTTAASQ